MSMEEEQAYDYDYYFRYCGTYFCMGLVSYLPAQYPERNAPLIAHMLGFLLGIFPVQFFIYASFASYPPPELEPPSTMTVWSLWIIFIVTVLALIYITTRPIVLGPREELPIKGKKS